MSISGPLSKLIDIVRPGETVQTFGIQEQGIQRERIVATYMIFIREGEVFDPAEMAAYQQANRENIGQHALKPLVVYGDMETLEGDAPDGIVVLEFPSAQDAKSWYNSPAYQSAAEHRKRAADYRVIMVEGLPKSI